MTELTIDKLKFNEPYDYDDPNPCMGESYIPVEDGQEILLFAYSSQSYPITIHGGDGVFAGKDLKVDLYNDFQVIPLESGPFMCTTGPNKGRIIISGEEYSAFAVRLA